MCTLLWPPISFLLLTAIHQNLIFIPERHECLMKAVIIQMWVAYISSDDICDNVSLSKIQYVEQKYSESIIRRWDTLCCSGITTHHLTVVIMNHFSHYWSTNAKHSLSSSC